MYVTFVIFNTDRPYTYFYKKFLSRSSCYTKKSSGVHEINMFSLGLFSSEKPVSRGNSRWERSQKLGTGKFRRFSPNSKQKRVFAEFQERLPVRARVLPGAGRV
jgi:hypothetical protein